MIRVYNTLSKSKEPFQTVQPGKVGIYLCGPTVYRPSHIGHMVGPVIFDTIKRYLTYCGYQVTLVINVTDVDDKLIKESQARGVPMSRLAEQMTADYMRNIEALQVDTVDHFPRATEHIPQIIEFVGDLIRKGFAYVSDGDVYYEVARFPEYGKLSGRTLESMLGEGGTTGERKRSAADFALWKSAKPGEPSWTSPWGPGRPGWHIECSVMSGRLLGATFDIHGGGLDLVFPHHENEIAQSEARHGKPMALYWMHNGLMQDSSELGKLGGRRTRPVEGDIQSQDPGKISKSRGASPFSELLADFEPETIRFFLLSTHYRRPIDFSEERIREVGTGLGTFYRFFRRFERITGQDFYALSAPGRRSEGDLAPQGEPLLLAVAELRERFLQMMDDDFNTGGAIGVLFDLVRRLNKFADDEKLEQAGEAPEARLAGFRRGAQTLRELALTLGLFRRPPKGPRPQTGDDALVNKLVELLVEIRADARKARNFAAADRIRTRLAELGIRLEDRPGGTEWSRN
ncbi:MAG: cysteine--tRNA ligase [Thermoguttaceae bacterium]